MIRSATFAVTFVLAGCGHDSQPAAAKSTAISGDSPKTITPSPTTVKYDVNHGEFFVEFDDAGGGLKLDTKSADGDGGKGKQLRHEVVWKNGARRLTVENGSLTVDGKSRGKIDRGARIHIDASGEVHVNEPKP